MKYTKRFFVIVGVVIVSTFFLSNIYAADRQATSCSQVDVQTAINTAQDGDTVTVPAGSCAWSVLVTIPNTKGITLQGAGIGKTVITDNVPTTGFLFLNSGAGKTYRVTGFEFMGGVSTKSNAYGFFVNGQSNSVRIDHNKFNNLKTNYLSDFRMADVLGVADHNIFEIPANGYAMYISHPAWQNVGLRGHNSWAQDSGYGTNGFIFVEDNTFNSPSNMHVTDGDSGGRMVFRHNTVVNGIVGWHGADSSGWDRGFRVAEIYDNTFTNYAKDIKIFQIRSGTGVIYNNSIKGYSTFATLNNYRSTGDGVQAWGPCSGLGPYDDNDPAGIFATGKHTATGLGSEILTDSSKSWTPNQWAGYTLLNIQAGSRYVNGVADIISNTSNTITTSELVNNGIDLKFDSGDSYEIRKANVCMDQVGRGKGNLLTGDTHPIPASWPRQVLEPMYAWNNISDGLNTNMNSGSTHVKVNRDFFNNTPKPGYTSYVYPHPLVNGAVVISPPSSEPTIVIPPQSTQPTTTTKYNLGATTLRNGSRGEGVKELQRFLNAKLNLGLVIDGKLGPKTIAVIKTWQKSHGLVADGLIGPKTKAMMNGM